MRTGCHDCEHAEAIGRGVYADTEWPDTPCATCPAIGNSRSWRFDEELTAAESVLAPEVDDGSGMRLGVDVLPVCVLAELLRGLMTLPPRARDILSRRCQGWTYGEIADEQGVTAGAVELHHRRILDRMPAWRALFAGKVVKRVRRKARKQDGIRRGTGRGSGANRKVRRGATEDGRNGKDGGT